MGYQTSKFARQEKADSHAVNHVHRAPRELQKAKHEVAGPKTSNGFRAFSGSGSRIDGKKSGSTPEKKEDKETEPKGSGPIPQPVVPSRQSLIGDKYSKKKSSASAFTGTAYKLK